MKRQLFAAAVLLLGLACVEQAKLPTGTTNTRGVNSTATAPDSTATVTVGDSAFTPSSVTIAAGGTVTWTWTGKNSHNVTFSDSTIQASPTQTTGTFSHTFPTAGTFGYFDSVSGSAVMSGSVVVQ